MCRLVASLAFTACIRFHAGKQRESAMRKRIFQLLLVIAISVASFGSVGGVRAGSNCANYYTVQLGDTLSGIAVQCGTTMDAIRAANPGLAWWVYAGQVLCIPTANTNPAPPPTYNDTYVVQWGDTLGKIAARMRTSVSALLAVNPKIWNPSLIYTGQVINLPSGVSAPPPPPSATPLPNYPPVPVDSLPTLRIAYQYGLFVRSTPGGSIIASGRNNSAWLYIPDSVFTDSKGKVWVQVHLYPAVKGYHSGWMLVRDQLGHFFTNPAIDP